MTAFPLVRDLIEARCGLRFDDSQRPLLTASVSARMQQLGLDREDEYVDRLRGEAPSLVEAELRQLLNLVTVTETCFFRDAAQFRLLREHIIPSLLDRRLIRIWSAGCSSGEEAYSIALTLIDMGLYDGTRQIEIIGTDVNTSAMDRAKQAVYSPRAVRHVDGRLLDLYFVRDGENFALIDAVKQKVKFEFGNLTQTPMPSTGPQDIIFCKNVAIYFRPEATRKLIDGLRDTLTPGGYLLLGHAESLWEMPRGFALVEYERAFCYRKMPQPTAAAAKSFQPKKAAVPAAPETSIRTSSRHTQYELCLSLYRHSEWDKAEAGLVSLIASYPTYVPAHLLLGGLYANRGRFDEAIQQAEAVLRLSDLEPRAHLLLGMIAARRQRREDALQALRRALYLDDTLALAHFWLGNFYRDRGDLARACQEYANVVRDWERHTLDFTEEFALDLTPEQLVGFCSDSLHRLQETAHG